MKLRFELWLASNEKHKIILALLGVVVILAVGFLGYSQVTNYLAIQSKPQTLQKQVAQNAKVFDVLYQKKSKLTDGTYTFTYDLYLKQPFIDEGNLNSYLDNFMNSVKTKYNGATPTVRSIGIRIYDRKVAWDMGLTPRAIAQYALDPDYVESSGANSASSSQVSSALGAANLSSSDDTGTGVSNVSPMQTAWTATNAATGGINYDNYTMSTLGVHTYDRSSVANPLSDKEFAFWIKIKEYQAILGASNIDAAVNLYLNYDLNGQVNQRSFYTIQSDFENFDKRQTSLGDTTPYFPNTVLLKDQLALYRPQLLYYVLSGGVMLKSYEEAQKKLISVNSDEYGNLIKDHISTVSKNVDKFGRVNYYQDYRGGKYVNTDPFVSIMGRYQAAFPIFSRPDYQPTLEGNNIFYSQQFLGGVAPSDLNDDN